MTELIKIEIENNNAFILLREKDEVFCVRLGVIEKLTSSEREDLRQGKFKPKE